MSVCKETPDWEDKEDKKNDFTTEEGKKEYLESAKNDFKERYQRAVEYKIQDELDKKARLEAIKELGITEEEYDSAFRRDCVYREEDYVKFPEDEICKVVSRIKEIQEQQNEIINTMIDKEKHIEAEKNNVRNSMVTQYHDLEILKRTLLDTLSSAYLKVEGCINVVNERGSKFSE